MSTEHLVQMANDIGHFFAAEPKREDAIAGIATISALLGSAHAPRNPGYASAGGQGLEDLVREAVGRLKVPAATNASRGDEPASRCNGRALPAYCNTIPVARIANQYRATCIPIATAPTGMKARR